MLASKTFLFVGQSSQDFFLERGRNRCRSLFFQILDIWRISGDIRDQSRKLSKSRGTSDVFFLCQILGGRPSKSYTQYPCLEARSMENVLRGYFHYPEVIVAITLNFKPNFKFSRLNFFGGTPVPLQVCAIKAWSISSACKILRAQHPVWAEI